MSHRVCGLISAFVLLFWSQFALAQQQQPLSTTPLSQAQMDQLVAPIALHPDPLLSQMLMASTYPTEVVQAARWVAAHPKTTGQALQDAMAKEPWDPSVKALAAVPQVLKMMSDKLDWTQQLGDAFLAQQDDLMAAVQRLRQRAENAGNLKTSDKQTVRRVSAPAGGGGSGGGGGSMIAIEPANPDYLYVPVYDPRVCYGDWPYAAYEPFYWYPADYVGTGVLSFAAAVAIGSAIWGNVDWWNRRVDIDVNRYNKFNRTNITDNSWRHDARHRGNVPYRDANVAQRFGDNRRDAARDNYRGKAEAGRRDLAKSDKAGNRGERANARPGDRQKSAKGGNKGGDRQKSARSGQGQKGKAASARNKSAGKTKHASRPSSASRQRSASHRGGRQMSVRHSQTRAFRGSRGGGPRVSMGGGGRSFGRGGGGGRGFGGGGRRGGRR